MRRPVRTAFALLCAVPFLMVLGNSMLFPVFPKLQAALHISEVRTGLVVSAFSIPAGVLIPLAGYLSDRFSRKAVMVPGVFLFGLGSLVAGLAVAVPAAPSFRLLLVGRAIQGIGAAGMAQLAIALTADIFRSEERSKALGLLEGANGLGKVVSPVAGALAGLVLWWLPFFVFVALALPVAGLLWAFVREPAGGRRPSVGYARAVRRLAAAKGVSLLACLLAGGVLFAVLFGTLFFLSETLEKTYRMSELAVGLSLALPVAAMSGTSLLTGSLLQRRPAAGKPTAVLGMGVVAAVAAGVVAVPGKAWLLTLVSGLGLAAGAVIPSLTLLITSSSRTGERGLITSLYGGFRFFGVAVGPPVFGALMAGGRARPFLAAAAAAVAAGAVLAVLGKTAALLGPSPAGGAPEGGRTAVRSAGARP